MDETLFNQIEQIKELVNQYQNWYWTSDFDDINLINDLRLSSNIHETAHSRILFKLLKAGKRYGFPLWQEFSKMLKWETFKPTSFGPPEKYNIDLLIEGEVSKDIKFAVIIENKANDAVDQYGQLKKYIDSLKDKESFKEEQIYVVYLTRNKDGKEPSEDSFPSDMKKRFVEGNRYHHISYEKEIQEWIDVCQKIWVNDLIRSVLIQYGNYLTSLFKPNKEKEKVMINNIDDWCFEGDSSSKSLSEVYATIHQKMEAMNELQHEMDLFYREFVFNKMKGRKLDVKKDESQIHYIWFKVEYLNNGTTLNLKGHLNFRNDYDGYRIWFGIEIDSQTQAIKQYDTDDMIKDDAAEAIKNNLTKNLSGYRNDKSPYLCWQYSTLDTVIDDICSYCNRIREIK